MIKKIAKIILFDNKSKKFLLQLRDNSPSISYPNTWTLFGGRIEKNETPEEAIKRELKEEISGLKIGSIKKLFTKNRYQDGLKVEDNIFYAEIVSDLSNTNLLEGQKMRLFSKIELNSDKIFPPFKSYIQKFQKDMPVQ